MVFYRVYTDVMMFYLLFALSAVAGMMHEEGAAHALRTVFSTDDVHKLQGYAADPESLWRERKEVLFGPGGSVDHETFCRQYRQEAAEFVKNCPEPPVEQRPWFWDDLGEIEDVVSAFIPKGHPAGPTALALFYAYACDYLHAPTQKSPVRSREALFSYADTFMRLGGSDITEEFNQKMRWVSGEEFSIVDSLVMHNEGCFLGSMVEPHLRAHFKAHEKKYLGGRYIFCGWAGAFQHDCLSHALRQYMRAKILKRYGICEVEHFRLYCHPKYMPSGDIVAQAQRYLASFFNVHEASVLRGSYHPMHLESVLFPHVIFSPDYGFNKIVPYFVKYADAPEGYLLFEGKNVSMQVYKILLNWRNQYCQAGWDIFPAKYFTCDGGWGKRIPAILWKTRPHLWIQYDLPEIYSLKSLSPSIIGELRDMMIHLENDAESQGPFA